MTKKAIYIDGAPFHRGERLRRDRFIRRRLTKGTIGLTVIEFKSADLSNPAEVVEAAVGARVIV